MNEITNSKNKETGNELCPCSDMIPACPDEVQDKLFSLADKINAEFESADIQTRHVLHGGMYTRTVFHKAGILIIGAPWNVECVFIVSGHIRMFVVDKVVEIDGYNILKGSVGRMVAYYTLSDVWITTVFPTSAKTIREAEVEAFGIHVDELLNGSEEQE